MVAQRGGPRVAGERRRAAPCHASQCVVAPSGHLAPAWPGLVPTGSACQLFAKSLNKTAGASARRWRDAATLRNGLVDYGRLVAVIGIVWFHCKAPGYLVAYAGLPFFLVLLALPSQQGLARRAQRLLIPFAVWSGIYAFVFVLMAARNGEDLLGWWRPYMFVSGPSIHLWFLPFALVVSCVAPMLRGRLVIALPLLAACLLAAVGEITDFPWYQWSFALIPVLAGFAFLKNRSLGLLSLAASFLVLELFRPSPDNLVIAGGTATTFLAMTAILPATLASDWCARLSTSVYLCHILVMLRFKFMGLDGYTLGLATVAGALLMALGIELVLNRLRSGPSHGSVGPTP